MASALPLLALVILLALVFDYINGFHDTANAVATVVSTNVLPGRTAVLLAAACNFLGAFFGVGVAKTIGGDIADPVSITQTVVVAALVGAIAWNLLTWYYGIPSSSSHALIGGIVGAAWCHEVLESRPAGAATHLQGRAAGAGGAGALAAVRPSRRVPAHGGPAVGGPADEAGDGQPRLPAPTTGLGRVHGAGARLQRRPEVDGHHHNGSGDL
jgi:hypothetical protein